MDELRSQWAALMGDLQNPANPMENKGFTDNDVCKMYLVGICPFDLFENTVRHSRVDITLLRNITSVHAKRNTQTNCVPSELATSIALLTCADTWRKGRIATTAMRRKHCTSFCP